MMSRMDLARAVDFVIGPQQIGRYELGENHRIPLNVVAALASALNVNIKDLTDDAKS